MNIAYSNVLIRCTRIIGTCSYQIFINLIYYAGPLANNFERSCCRNIDKPEGTNRFCWSWYTVKQLNQIWSWPPINILWSFYCFWCSSFLCYPNLDSLFVICCELLSYFVEHLTTSYYRSMLWVGPALIFSSATAISMLGWDNKVRSILSTNFPRSGNSCP